MSSCANAHLVSDGRWRALAAAALLAHILAELRLRRAVAVVHEVRRGERVGEPGFSRHFLVCEPRAKLDRALLQAGRRAEAEQQADLTKRTFVADALRQDELK